jgi:hypothetical protein
MKLDCELFYFRLVTLPLLEWLYSPCGPSPLFSFLIYFSTIGRTP